MAFTSSPIDSATDRVLDATTVADDEYLRELGYEPKLTRALGLFSSFAIQFGQIAPLGGIVFTLSVGLIAVGPATMWPWVIAGALQVLIAVLVAEACSAYPVAGGAYNIVSRRGGRFIGWQTGWWIELAHIMSVSSSCIGITPVIMAWFGITPSHWQTVGIAAALILVSTLINLATVKVGSIFINISAVAFEVMAVIGLYVSAVVLQMAGARVLWAQGRDNKLPFASFFTHLNKEHVPSYGIWFTAVVAVLTTLWSSLYVVLIAMTVVLWVAGYGVLLTVMWIGRLRDTVPHGAFRAPAWRIAYPVAILWSALLCSVLIYQNVRQVGMGLLIAVLAGLIVYQFLPKSATASSVAPSLAE